jgi:riboflavin biosynthesis pyrimidine reductase
MSDKKPHVSACLAVSLDGRISWPDSTSRRLGSEADLARFFDVCQHHDAILTGASTVRAFPKPLKSTPYVHLILTQSGELPWDAPLFDRDSPADIWIFSPQPSPDHLPQNVTRWLQTETPVLCVHKALINAGIHSLLITGGGQILSLWLNAHALETLHLTLTPHLMGAEAASLCPAVLDHTHTMALIAHERHGDEIWLTYQA